jgi:hypothetical protein
MTMSRLLGATMVAGAPNPPKGGRARAPERAPRTRRFTLSTFVQALLSR